MKQVKDAKDGPVSSAGQYSFAGLEDAYFAGVFLPEGRALVEMTEFSDPDSRRKRKSPIPRVGAAVGGEGSNTFTFFAGPKDYKLLGKINPKLEQLIDWSWLGVSLGFIAKPIFLVLSWTADHVTRQLRLGHRAGDHRDQHGAVSPAPDQHEIVARRCRRFSR